MDLAEIFTKFGIPTMVAMATTVVTIWGKGAWDQKVVKTNSRRALIEFWRSDLFDGYIFNNEDGSQRVTFVGGASKYILQSKSWPTLKNHVSEETKIQLLNTPIGSDGASQIISREVGHGNHHLKELLINEINCIEKKWDLI